MSSTSLINWVSICCFSHILFTDVWWIRSWIPPNLTKTLLVILPFFWKHETLIIVSWRHHWQSLMRKKFHSLNRNRFDLNNFRLDFNALNPICMTRRLPLIHHRLVCHRYEGVISFLLLRLIINMRGWSRMDIRVTLRWLLFEIIVLNYGATFSYDLIFEV